MEVERTLATNEFTSARATSSLGLYRSRSTPYNVHPETVGFVSICTLPHIKGLSAHRADRSEEEGVPPQVCRARLYIPLYNTWLCNA